MSKADSSWLWFVVRRAIWWLGILLFVSVFSSFVLLFVLRLPVSNSWKVFLCLLAITIAPYIVFRFQDFFRLYLGRSLFVLTVLYSTAYLSMLLVKNSSQNKSDLVINFVTPGTFLVLLVATVTVLGFTITLTRLHESHVRISSYEDLLQRLARLLDVTLQAHGFGRRWWNRIEIWLVAQRSGLATYDYEGLKILCTVPTVGNMSHHGLFLGLVYPRWKQVAWCESLKVELISIDASPAATSVQLSEILPRERAGLRLYDREDFDDTGTPENMNRERLLNATELGKFYCTFKARGFNSGELRRGMSEAMEILSDLTKSQQNSLISYPFDHYAELPPIHLFWTRKRAIVAVPLDRGIKRGEHGSSVTMVGYETTDLRIIEVLLDVYNEWKTKINSSRLGAHSTPGLGNDTSARNDASAIANSSGTLKRPSTKSMPPWLLSGSGPTSA